MDPDGNGDVESFFQKLYNLYNLYNLQTKTDELVTGATSSGSRFVLSEALIKDLHLTAMNKLLDDAGLYRKIAVSLTNSPHVPPNWLNWIHPFRNGNGRTARAASYLVLGAKYGKLLPPKNTVIEQIVAAKPMHDHLLRQADMIYTSTQNIEVAIKPLCDFMNGLLINQIRSYFSGI